MQFARRLLVQGAFLLAPLSLIAQEVPSNVNAAKPSVETAEVVSAQLPDAPVPQASVALSAVDEQQSGGQSSSQSSSSLQEQTQPQAAPAPSARQKAQQQLNEQKHQRVLGVLPMFNTTYRADAVSLTPKEKISLAFRSAVDPATFAVSLIVAGFHEALDDDPGFGWGPEGYGKRAGAAYLDAFDGTMIGNGILPVIFHQDPRYFRLGHGTTRHRMLYAAATSWICKHDNTGKWEMNYSNIGGNIISGAISNLYYPSTTSGWGQTISNGMVVTAEGTAGAFLQEFWPDISRKFFHKDPTNGLDKQAREADAAKKKNLTQPLPPQK